MNNDQLIVMIMDHETRLQYIEKNMATKQDIRGIHDTLDTIVGLLRKHEQETTLMSYRLQEHDKILEEHGKILEKHDNKLQEISQDVKDIKNHLGLFSV